MKLTKILCFVLILVLCLLFPIVSFAKDTDIYMGTGAGVQPNILIIFDNSISMNTEILTRDYDKTVTYSGSAYRDKVYKKSGSSWVLFGNYDGSDIDDIPAACTDVRYGLTENNFATGYTALCTTGSCKGKCTKNNLQLRTGNYLNYENSPDTWKTKLWIAQDAIKKIIDGVGNVKVGLMVFNTANYSDPTVHGTIGPNGNSHGGKILSDVMDLTAQVDDPYDTHTPKQKISHKDELKARIDHINPDAFTPLAETLYEAGLYFNGAQSYFNSGVNYSSRSPIEFSCQKNYIIIMTDGDPTKDDGYRPGDNETGLGSDAEAHPHILANVVGDRDGDGFEPGGAHRVHYTMDDYGGADWGGTDYLDDVAKYLYDRPAKTGMQNIVTYTIGFNVTPQNNLLGRTATQGGGKYKTAKDSLELVDAFQAIVGDILEQTTSFVAPIVPVSRMEKETAGDKLYLALFQPNNDLMWSGNIKKFGVVQSGANLGQIIDKNGTPALDGNKIKDSATSYWSTKADGSFVELEGIGGVLKSQTTRNIYTFKGTSYDLTDNSNKFDADHITPAELGLGSDTTARDSLIKYVYGYDAYSENEGTPKGPTAKRDWMLGAFLHSRPLVIHYAGTTSSYIFAGSNDGMLHAFRDDTGEEVWGFIPPDLLLSLPGVHSANNVPFVDGSAKAYVNATYKTDGTIDTITEAILIFGERRGGNHYYALDVTTPSQPKFLWYINSTKRVYRTPTNTIVPDTSTAYDQLGQTWSTPVIGKVACQTADTNCTSGTRWVAFIGGGYAENQDNINPDVANELWGRAVYVVDIKDGSLVKRFSQSDSAYSATMTYSIPSDIAKVDTDGDGKINRLYVGDTGGRMWRFDVEDPNRASWSGRIIFQSNPGDDATTGRRIFYPPDVTLEKGYEMLFFGTGDREHPQDETIYNRIYAVKDKSAGTTLIENNLYDVTTDELQAEGTTEQRKSAILSALTAADGWFIKIGTGEKCLAPPVVFYGTAYFTTFSPEEGTDPCQAQFGTARMYELGYKTGNAVFNYDLENDAFDAEGKRIEALRRTDRLVAIGTAIPSGVIITFIGGTAVAYTGVGGGVDSPQLPNTKSIVPVYWRTVF